ncbi:tetratricopeptide repeat protein [Petrachloros mirabilis]
MDQNKEPLDQLLELAEKESEVDGREIHVVELLRPYLEKRPDHGYAWLLYGDSLRIIGRTTEALAALSRALELAPEGKKYLACNRIAVLHEQLTSQEEAEKWHRKATDSADAAAPGWLWILRGANLARMERFEEALDCYETAATRDEVDVDEAFLNMGKVHRAKGDYARARRCFEKALEIDPDYSQAREALDSLKDIEATLETAKNLGAE